MIGFLAGIENSLAICIMMVTGTYCLYFCRSFKLVNNVQYTYK
jgi:hypothetical protein